MFQAVEDARPQKARPGLKYSKYAALAVLLFVALIGALYAFIFVRVVPPLSTKVVDAVTGKPISGMNVCLEVSVGPSTHQVLRKEISKSSPSGWTFFWPSVHNLILLGGWGGYRIRVTDPQTEFAEWCEPSPRWNPESNPWPMYLGEGESGHPRYFPVALVKQGDFEVHDLGWRAMRRRLGFPLRVHIPLIPVLENMDGCKHIQDPSLAEDCRQLNTYAAAMSLVDNQDAESRRRARELCQEVDHSRLSSQCVGNLEAFAMLREARHFRGDYSRTADVPARQTEDLFPANVAGVPRINAQMYDDGSLGTGRRGYSASYSQPGNAPALIGAQMEEFPNAQLARERLDELPGGFADHAPGTVKEEKMGPGQRIGRHRGSKYSGAFWTSKNRVILITFYQPFAREEEFIGGFLAHFPSTL